MRYKDAAACGYRRPAASRSKAAHALYWQEGRRPRRPPSEACAHAGRTEHGRRGSADRRGGLNQHLIPKEASNLVAKAELIF